MNNSRSYLLQKPKSVNPKRRMLYFIIALMLLMLAVVFSVNVVSTLNSFHNSAEWAQSLRQKSSGSDVIYLLYGVDYWGASPYVERLLLLHHDTSRGQVSLIYIPGNTMVSMAERGPEPLGQAYRRLQNPSFINLVQELTGLPVHHYIEINYQGIAVVGDYLGGVSAGELPDGSEGALLPHGKDLLTGFELYRYFLTNDYREPAWDQLNRQRHVLLQYWRQLEQFPFWRWPRLLKMATAYLETDLSWRELNALREQFQDYSFAGMQTVILPGVEELHDGCLYWVTQPEAVADMVRMVNAGYLVAPAQVTVEVLNGSGIPGLAGRLADHLKKEGFLVVGTGNADHFEYEESLVIARGEVPDKARAVALFVSGSDIRHEYDPEARVDVTVIIGSSYLQQHADD